MLHVQFTTAKRRFGLPCISPRCEFGTTNIASILGAFPTAVRITGHGPVHIAPPPPPTLISPFLTRGALCIRRLRHESGGGVRLTKASKTKTTFVQAGQEEGQTSVAKGSKADVSGERQRRRAQARVGEEGSPILGLGGGGWRRGLGHSTRLHAAPRPGFAFTFGGWILDLRVSVANGGRLGGHCGAPSQFGVLGGPA